MSPNPSIGGRCQSRYPRRPTRFIPAMDEAYTALGLPKGSQDKIAPELGALGVEVGAQ
jgi:hypothetical protein